MSDARKEAPKDVRPFFPTATAPSPTRALGAVLPALVTQPVTSPWLPRPAEPVATAAGPSPDQAAGIAALREDARAQGRAEGLAETAEMREELTALIAGLRAPAGEIVAPAAELVAEVAAVVIETWLGHTDRSALFAPIVQSWLARSPSQPATARVNPADAAALAAAIGGAPLTVAPDAAMSPGALEITSPTLELTHDWRTRLDELRTAVAAALTDDAQVDGSTGSAIDAGEPA
jgi:flagellar biosynthesis/type III secretory pathway protein FliH